MTWRKLFLLSLIVLLLVIGPVMAGNISIMGRTDSAPVLRVIINQGYLYAGGYAPNLKVFDVSTYEKQLAMNNATNYSLEIAKIPLDDRINYLLLDGTDLFAATDYRLYVFDVSTPELPVLRGSAATIETYVNYGLANQDGRGGGMAIYGNYLYGSLGEHGYAIFDISNRDSPTYLKRVTTRYAGALTTSDEGYLVYAGTSATQPNTPGIWIENLTIDPTTPVYVSNLNYTSGGDVCQNDGSLESIMDLIVNGTTVYLLSYHCGVYSINMSNPSSPYQLDNLTMPKPETPPDNFNAARMNLGNSGLLYVSTRYSSMKILNVSDPSNMVVVGNNIESFGYSEDIYPSEDETYTIFGASGNGIIIDNTTIKSSPTTTARITAVQAGVRGITVIGDKFVMGGHNVGVYVANTSNKSAPVTVGMAPTGGRITGLAEDGVYAYTAPCWHGVDVLNVTLNSTSPDILYTGYAGGGSCSIERISPHFFVTNEQIWNMTTPLSPSYKVWYPGTSIQGDLAVSKLNNTIMITSFPGTAATGYNKGISAWDISDPWNPVRIGYAMNDTGFYSVVANGTRLIATTGSGLYTFNISGGVTGDFNSSFKQYYGGEANGYGCLFTALDGSDPNRLYCSYSVPSQAIKEYDISNISDIKKLSSFSAFFGGGELVYNDGYLYTGYERSDGVILTTYSTKINIPPVLATIGQKNIPPTTETTFTISATDNEGETPGYYATGLPIGATFTNSTHTFAWTPSTEGLYNCTFWANDTAGATDSEKVYFNVSNAFITATQIRINITTKDTMLYRSNLSGETYETLVIGAGTTDSNTSTIMYAGVESGAITDNYIRNRIIVLPVDLTSVPDEATITNLTLFVYEYEKNSGIGTNQSLVLTYGNPVNKSVPEYPDFQNIDRIPIAPNITYNQFTAPSWGSFILSNRTGLIPGQFADLVLMDHYTADKTNYLNQVGGSVWKANSTGYFKIESADHTTENNRPYVIIEYTTEEEPVAPTTNFDGVPLSGETPLFVSFTDLSTNTPTSWNWTFGGGNYSSLQNPTYTFTGAGTYTVILNATNDGGSDIETKIGYITVTNPTPPVVAFSANVTSGTSPLPVLFTDSSTNTPTSWYWTFGGANHSTDQNPTYTFTGAGIYTVSLEATNADGSDTETKVDYITISAEPTPTPTPTPTSTPDPTPTKTFQEKMDDKINDAQAFLVIGIPITVIATIITLVVGIFTMSNKSE